MSFDSCPICGKYDFTDKHKCRPKWEVNIPDYHGEDDWDNIVYAYDEEDAAKDMAERYNSNGDYALMDGDEITVLVRKPGETEVKTFICSAEPDIIYYATEKKTDKKTNNAKNNM